MCINKATKHAAHNYMKKLMKSVLKKTTFDSDATMSAQPLPCSCSLQT